MNQPMSPTLRKAAVLIRSLDEDSADELLEQVSEWQAERVRAAMMDLGDVDALEQRAVMDEFLRGSYEESQPGSAEASATHGPGTNAGQAWEEEGDELWEDADASPTTKMPGASSRNASLRPAFIRLQPVAPSARDDFDPQECETSECEPSECEPGNRALYDGELLDHELPQFDDLAGLDDKGLALLLQAVEPEVVLLALAGAGQGMLQRVMQPLKFRQARALQRRLQQLGPLRLADIDGAQQRMVQAAVRLIAEGQVREPAGSQAWLGGAHGEDH